MTNCLSTFAFLMRASRIASQAVPRAAAAVVLKVHNRSSSDHSDRVPVNPNSSYERPSIVRNGPRKDSVFKW